MIEKYSGSPRVVPLSPHAQPKVPPNNAADTRLMVLDGRGVKISFSGKQETRIDFVYTFE